MCLTLSYTVNSGNKGSSIDNSIKAQTNGLTPIVYRHIVTAERHCYALPTLRDALTFPFRSLNLTFCSYCEFLDKNSRESLLVANANDVMVYLEWVIEKSGQSGVVAWSELRLEASVTL